MPALLQDAYRGVSPAVLSTWPGGVGVVGGRIPLRGGATFNHLQLGIPTGAVSGMLTKYNRRKNMHYTGSVGNTTTSDPKNETWDLKNTNEAEPESTTSENTNTTKGGARKHRRRPTRKASRKVQRKVQRKSRRLTRRR